MEIQPAGQGKQPYEAKELEAGRFFPHMGGKPEVQEEVSDFASASVKPDASSPKQILSAAKRPLKASGTPIDTSTKGVKELNNPAYFSAVFSSVSRALDELR